jgi:aspartate beta-hydroxylase
MLLAAQQESTDALTRWAVDHDVDRRDLDRVYRGLRSDEPVRAQAHRLQTPAVHVPGLESAAWHGRARFPWVQNLEQAYPRIRAEFERQHSGTGLNVHPESAELAESGSWNTYHFYRMGVAFPEHLADCPATAAALSTVPGVADAGMCYFSVMGPKTKVRPHCGFVNTRIRCHLGLVVPPDCQMRVGTETRSWQEGGCLVFDDSYEHEVANRSDRRRAVLLLDTWHPDLSEPERRAMSFLMGMWTADVD